MKKAFFLIFFGFFFAPMLASADIGDNCRTDITGSLPDSTDWRTVYTVEGDDGSAWRRAIVNKPDGFLKISEGSVFKIIATALPHAETEVFIYAAEDSSSEIRMPGEGVCFEGPSGNEKGSITFPISSRLLWNNIDSKIVVDVFYRLPESWNDLNQSKSANTFNVGTGMLPKVIQVALETEIQDETERKGRVMSGLSGFEPEDKTDVNYIESLSDEDSFAEVENNSVTEREMPVCPLLCNEGVHLAVMLDPSALPPQFQGSTFDGVGGRSVIIGRLPGPHTLYAGTNGDQTVQKDDLKLIVHSSIYFEMLKRALLGNENANGEMPGLGELRSDTLRDAAAGKEEYSEHTVQLAQNIKYILVNSQLRAPAAKFIADSIKETSADLMKLNSTDWNMESGLLLAIPEKSSSELTWAEDFLTLLQFWTGSTNENICLLLNDNKIGTALTDNYYTDSSTMKCNMSYFSGETPLIVLNTLAPVILTPAFNDTKIVYAEQEFTAAHGWTFPAGKKQPLSYRYDFTAAFPKERAGEMCVKKTKLPLLLSALKEKYGLTADETSSLAQELTAEFPKTADFVKLSLANPADIASRFVWNGNGQPLSLLQLFFEFTPNGCRTESLLPPALDIPVDRNGFEVGILR